MMKPEQPKTEGTWRCNACRAEEEVTNGVCAKCGPTQTTPVDEDALTIAGVALTKEPDTEDS